MKNTALTAHSKSDQAYEKALKKMQSGNMQAAEKQLKRLVQTDPKYAPAYATLGDIALKTGRKQMALQHYPKSLNLNRINPKAWRNLARIQIEVQADFNAALNSLTNAISQDDKDHLSYHYLGKILQQFRQHQEAIEMFDKCLEFKPDHAETISAIGLSFINLRQFEDGKEKLLQAYKIAPQNPKVFSTILTLSNLIAFNEEQEKILSEGLEQYKKNPDLRNAIILHKAHGYFRNKDHGALEDVLNSMVSSSPEDKNKKYHILADSARLQNETDIAFKYYTKANEIKKTSKLAKATPKDVLNKLVESITSNINDEYMESLKQVPQVEPQNYQSPLFLCGFARSGTTLSGQILDQHPRINTADELGAIDMIRLDLQQQYHLDPILDLPQLKTEPLTFLQDLYTKKQNYIPKSHKDQIFIDKMPFNMLHAIFISTVFPKSKFLYIKRHPLDCVLSGYMQNFAINNAMIHFLDIHDIAHLYIKCHEAWSHQKKFGTFQYHEYKYENLIADFDFEIRGILNFIGVEWNEAVHDFHKQQNSSEPKTLTPSIEQVNKALYQDALYRWKNYREYLEPIIPILEPIITELGYDID